MHKLKKSTERTNQHIQKQWEYIQGQINEIKNSVEDRQSGKAYQTDNEEIRRKSTSRVITDKPIQNIIGSQLDIKFGQFTKEELDAILKIIQNRKAAVLNRITPEVCKARKFDNILPYLCNAIYKQNIIKK